jgi:hypothetical protein
MSRRSVSILALAGLLALPGYQCGDLRPARPAARVLSVAPGSCDGYADYGDELEASNFHVGWTAPVGGGIWETEISFDLTNQGGASFRSASATADFSGFPELGVQTSPAPLPADFGPIAPHGSASASAPTLVRLPAAHFADLMQKLHEGAIPFVVSADEEAELAPGVEIHDWTSFEDRMYYLASQPSGGFGGPINADPGPGPFDPGQEFAVAFLEFSDYVPTVFDDWAPDELFYLVENPDGPLGVELVNIPDAYDRVRVVDAQRMDEDGDGFTLWVARLKRTDTESLLDIYTSASFCTGPSTTVGLPVEPSRLRSLDGRSVDLEESDANPQGIRFNGLPFANGAIKLYGQVQGHVLKPSLAFRVRDGRIHTQADFDTDLSLTAELRAEREATLAPEDVELWSLCFPLPEFNAGPISIPMSLQIAHTVGVEAAVKAGLAVGFEKHFDSGFGITCESGGGGGSSCTSDGHRAESPIQFTPPHLTDDTEAHARVETTLAGQLNFYSAYPICDLGPSLFLTTTAYGELAVSPTQDPWWSMDYGVDTTGGLELDLLGLELARFETDLFANNDPGPDSGVGGERTSGEDQRWAVAIDETAVPNGVSSTRIAALPDGSSLSIATEAIGGRNPLVKLDRYGALEWVKKFSKRVKRVHALPDGTAIAAGFEGYDAWLARVDASGNLIWSSDVQLSRASYTPGRCSIEDVAALEQSPGVYDYVAVGSISTGLVTTVDACAFRVNADGAIAWSRIYVGDGGQGFEAVTATRDGQLVAGGSDRWSYVGNRTIPIFVKLDATNGDVIFWKGMPMTRLGGVDSIVEASDGRIYAAGGAQGIIYSTGAGWVARIEADGSDGRMAMLLQDEDWEALLDFETWVDTAGGDTPYDEFYDIAQSGDGFVVVGHTGLGPATAAQVAKVDENLGLEWFTTFDTATTDNLTGVASASDGLFVSGYSGGLPEADGGSGENQLWVMKLPFTGAMSFLPDVGVTTRFVAPGVRDASSDHGVNPLDERLIDVDRTTEDTVFVSAAPNAGLLVAPDDYCVKLLTESGHASTLDTCAD